MRSQLLPLLLDRLRARGASEAAAALIREFEIPSVIDGAVRELTVPLETHKEICERAATVLGDPFVGLHVAAESVRGDFGIFDYAIRSAATVGEAFEKAQRYLPFLSDVVELSLVLAEGRATVTHKISGRRDCAGRHGNEYAMALFVRLAREVTGIRVSPDAVGFAHEPPKDLSELTAFFDTRSFSFLQSENRLEFGPSVLALPVTTRDPGLLKILDLQTEGNLERPHAGEAFSGLRRKLADELQPAPTLESIAAALRVAPRTLQRRLADAGTTFQRELDAVREHVAARHLLDERLSIYEIAVLVGYAEQRAFERAFLRWRGISPRQFRRSARRGS